MTDRLNRLPDRRTDWMSQSVSQLVSQSVSQSVCLSVESFNRSGRVGSDKFRSNLFRNSTRNSQDSFIFFQKPNIGGHQNVIKFVKKNTRDPKSHWSLSRGPQDTSVYYFFFKNQTIGNILSNPSKKTLGTSIFSSNSLENKTLEDSKTLLSISKGPQVSCNNQISISQKFFEILQKEN